MKHSDYIYMLLTSGDFIAIDHYEQYDNWVITVVRNEASREVCSARGKTLTFASIDSALKYLHDNLDGHPLHVQGCIPFDGHGSFQVEPRQPA